MKLGLWSTTAASNNTTPPDGWPEGQAPSTVNDCAREMMASIRTYSQDAQWFDHGMSPTFVNTTTFTVPGDQSTFLMAGRALKLYDGTTIYRNIGTVSASANTNVVLGAGTNITASLSSFAVGILTPTNNGLPTSYNRISASAVEITGVLSVSAVLATNLFATNLSAASAGITNLSAVTLIVTGALSASAIACSTSLSANAIFCNNITISGGAVCTGAYRAQNGTPSGPSYIMDAADNDTGMYWVGDGLIGWATNNVQGARLSTGGFVAVAFTVTSDSRTKINWTIPDHADMVAGLASMKAGSFERLKDGKRAVGVPAQDMQRLFPECVPMQADGTLLANYGPAAMVACVSLATQLEALRAEIALLKAKK